MLLELEPYCQLLARRFFAAGLEAQDIEQEARIGVWQAVSDFDPSRGEWKAFARLAATRNVLSAVRRATRGKHTILSQAAAYDEPSGNAAALADRLPAPLDVAAEYEHRERALYLLGHLSGALSGLEAEVLRRRAAGDDYATIQADLGVSERTIDNASQRVKRKAQAILAMYDEGREAA